MQSAAFNCSGKKSAMIHLSVSISWLLVAGTVVKVRSRFGVEVNFELVT